MGLKTDPMALLPQWMPTSSASRGLPAGSGETGPLIGESTGEPLSPRLDR
jgi:hypothetical protein